MTGIISHVILVMVKSMTKIDYSRCHVQDCGWINTGGLRTTFNKHMSRYHAKKKLVCDAAGCTFSTGDTYELNRHKLSHGVFAQTSCFCGTCFKTKSNFLRHVRANKVTQIFAVSLHAIIMYLSHRKRGMINIGRCPLRNTCCRNVAKQSLPRIHLHLHCPRGLKHNHELAENVPKLRSAMLLLHLLQNCWRTLNIVLPQSSPAKVMKTHLLLRPRCQSEWSQTESGPASPSQALTIPKTICQKIPALLKTASRCHFHYCKINCIQFNLSSDS